MGLALLAGLPETTARHHREINLQNALGVCLMPTRGFGNPEVAAAFNRAAEICTRVDDDEFWRMSPFCWLASSATVFAIASMTSSASAVSTLSEPACPIPQSRSQEPVHVGAEVGITPGG